MSIFSLVGKVAIVTGSTRGIGRAIVEEMARAGAKVVVSSRKSDACEGTVSELKAAGHEAIAVACNVGYKDQCQKLVDSALNTWGRVDTLVLNAAINPYFGSMQEMSDEVFDKMIATNLKAHPCRSANSSPCRVSRGLPPPSECALPGAPKKRRGQAAPKEGFFGILTIARRVGSGEAATGHPAPRSVETPSTEARDRLPRAARLARA
jgi:NAD(P)-dependent dehydrogenase (short-subunit alcohol dehydrogenase family)